MNKILIVEDDKDVRTTIVDLLESAEYSIISAQDGGQAIKVLEYEIPDLVISDIMMPDVDGYQLLDYFHKLPGASTVPFIFLTAKADFNDLRKGMTLGADDYLMKPFRAKELLQAVETQLKKKQRLDKKFDDIFLDISAYVPHELRTPLIPIIGYAELITEGIDELRKDEIMDMANKIKYSSSRLHKTIEKFIRYTSTRLKLSSKEFTSDKPKSYVGGTNIILEYTTRKMMQEALRDNDLELDIHDSAIKMSEADFEFVVEELLENALKFSSPGSKISIKGRVNSEYYKLEITDHGRGISKEQITNIIPFVQHERNKFQQQGNGLGLISVKNLMSLYQGSFKIESEINNYTTCILIIPLFNN